MPTYEINVSHNHSDFVKSAKAAGIKVKHAKSRDKEYDADEEGGSPGNKVYHLTHNDPKVVHNVVNGKNGENHRKYINKNSDHGPNYTHSKKPGDNHDTDIEGGRIKEDLDNEDSYMNEEEDFEQVDNELDELDEVEDSDLDESAASDTLRPNSMPVGPANKSAAIGKVVNAMAGMDKETINKFVASIELIGKEARNIPGGEAAKNKGTIGTKPSGAGVQLVTKLEDVEHDISDVIKEDVSSMFEGEELSEEFKERVAVLIESAINLKVDSRIVELEEEFETKYEEELDALTEGLVETLDSYLTYAVNEWTSENEVAITSSLKADLTEEFIESLKAVFSTHYVNVPEDRVDVIEEMSARIDELEEEQSRVIDELQATEAALDEATSHLAITEMAKGLTDSDAEKLFELAGSVEFDSVDDLRSKVGVLKETYFGAGKVQSKAEQPSVLFEEAEKLEEEEQTPSLRGPMAKYVDTLSRTIRK